MKILEIIAKDRLTSGGGIQMSLLANTLAKQGHNVTVIYNYNPKAKETEFSLFENTNIRIIKLPLDKLKLNLTALKQILSLRKFIKKENFDVIHSHKGRATSLVILATLGLDVPLIANRGVTNPLNFFNSIKYRTGKIKTIIAVSQAVKDVMVKTGKINPKKIVVVYGSVDLQVFNPDIETNFRQELGISNDEYVIGTVGNLGKRKGITYLIEAFRKFSKKYLAKLVIVGANPSQEFIKRYNDENIIYVGFRRDVPNCLSAFDCFAFAGIKEEGLTGTVREAAAMKLPIISTDVAGNGELIKNKLTGLLVPKRNHEAMCNAMIYIYKHPEEAKEFGENARLLVEKTMTNEIRAEKIIKIYQDAKLSHSYAGTMANYKNF